jgi:hypothetical protein
MTCQGELIAIGVLILGLILLVRYVHVGRENVVKVLLRREE